MSKHGTEPHSFARLAATDALDVQTSSSARGVIYAELETAHQIERVADMLETIKTTLNETAESFAAFLASSPLDGIFRIFTGGTPDDVPAPNFYPADGPAYADVCPNCGNSGFPTHLPPPSCHNET